MIWSRRATGANAVPEQSLTPRSYDQLYVGGEWVGSSGSETITVISPATEQPLATVPSATTADADRAVAAARAAFDDGPWPQLSVAQRTDALRPLAKRYTEGADDLAALITAEMGSPITFSKQAQALGPASMIDMFLDAAPAYPWTDTRPTAAGGESIVRRIPVGVSLAILPWNVPQLVFISKLLPALIAGCSIVVKPAPETPLDAFWLAELLNECDLPDGLVSVLPGGRELGEHLVTHPGIDKVAFTGSTSAGRRIGELCGASIKRCSLELGGKSAAIILDDASLEATVAGLRLASFRNSGQACAAQTRVLASAARYDEVVDALAHMVDDLAVGAPEDPTSEIGPMVSRRQQQRVEEYIALGAHEGARTVGGGPGRPDGVERGWYVRPTLFADVDNRMRIAQEEIFGPVISVIPYDDEADAVRIANESQFGLAGSVWTADHDHGVEVAGRVRTGTIGVNHYRADYGAPFGGLKSSGIGREYGPEGFDEYVELQTIGLLPADQR
jgi:betaine-aldehyde dehydrogenase